MSVEEVRRAGVMARVKDGKLKVSSAAEMLGLSYRQGKRLWRRYREKGSAGLVHGNSGRRSNQSKPRKFRAKVLRLVRAKYSGEVDQRFGPTLAAEHLASEDGLQVHPETLRLWMLEEGLWSRARQRQPYRSRRERKRRFGELIQLDGSFHEWLEKRGPRLCLMNMVDDATGETLAQFHQQETIWAAVDLMRAWVEEYGVPGALYTDWKNVYVRKPTEEERLTGTPALTQFGRMCAALGTRIIAASSPQAKGRVERNHGTHQDRLVKKLRRQGIDTAEEANTFLREHYLADHNRRFHTPAADGDDFHRKKPSRRELDSIFCLEQERVIGKDWVVRYDKRFLQLERESRYAPAGQTVLIREARDGQLTVLYRKQRIPWKELAAPPPKAPVAAPPQRGIRRSSKPAATHPWRRMGWVSADARAVASSGSPNPGLPPLATAQPIRGHFYFGNRGDISILV
jgi:transposase